MNNDGSQNRMLPHIDFGIPDFDQPITIDIISPAEMIGHVEKEFIIG